MTGEKDRGSTVEKLWKIDDEQLKTSRHDDIVLDLLSHRDQLKHILKLKPLTIGYEMADLKADTLQGIDDQLKARNFPPLGEHIYQGAKEKLPDPEAITTSLFNSYKVESEVPIVQRSNGFVVGFFDLFAHVDPYVTDEKHPNLGYYEPKGYSTCFMVQSYVRNIPDTNYLLKRPGVEKLVHGVAIEVKPTIQSFGATLRQLNLYRNYFGGEIILCSDDIKYKDAFASQGYRLATVDELLSKQTQTTLGAVNM